MFNVHEALFVRRSARLWRRSGTRLVRALLAIICVLTVVTGLALWRWHLAADAARERPWCTPYGTSL
jgi:hypothetical protein